MKPFRWDISKREQLGSLVDTTASDLSSCYYNNELRECAAKVVARSSDRKIVFVGRSPENIFDYLSGIFEGTSRESKIELLNISNRFHEIDDIANKLHSSYEALKEHCIDIGISPNHIISEPHGICFCDLVAYGGTFKNLFEFLNKPAVELRSDLPAIISKLGFIGITERKKNSPNTWRWQQNAEWVKDNKKLTVKNVSISWELWNYLGNLQVKVTKSNYPKKWDSEEIMLPPREEGNINALKQAFEIYNLGREQKKVFAESLSSLQELKESWVRSLVNELKQIA